MNLTQLVLEQLQKTEQDYLSGEQLSQHFNISRTAVWKHIKKLQAQGYEIKANSKLGYQLSFSPQPLDVERLKHVSLTQFQLNPIYKQQVESTQLDAKILAEQGAEEGTVVFAEQQLQGKGRLGRHWHSPYGKGIWMSFIMRPQVPLQFAPQLTLLMAVVLAETLSNNYHIPATIKWPNDVLIRGKKCSGILLESIAEEQRLNYVIAGIGINVNMSADDFPDELANLATSLRLETNTSIDRTDFLIQFYKTLDLFLTLYLSRGFEPIKEKWESYADGFGTLKLIKQGDAYFEAVPFKLDESGALWVRHKDGTEARLFAAEIGEVEGR